LLIFSNKKLTKTNEN